MALELIVSPFLNLLFDKLSSLIGREFLLLQGFNKDFENLSAILSIIKDVLVDAEVKQIKDKRTRDWLRELKHAAYDAEDVLDECEFEALQQESHIGVVSRAKKVSASLSVWFNVKQIAFRRNMGKKIKSLVEKFGEIDARRSMFQLIRGVSGIADKGLSRETSPFLTEPKTYGRDVDKETITEILLDNYKSSNDLSICPIVGLGGLGKTTLAQLVYHNDVVVNHFDARIWVCVSEDFSVKRITKMIIEDLTEKKCEVEDLSPMQNLLKKLLDGRSYLLVLDDVWDDKQVNWNTVITCLLECGGKRSSIIVTTRLPTVVSAITRHSTSCVINPAYDLKSLQEEDSWSLFQHHALTVEDKEKEDLKLIGKEIVEKCKGVPLAIKAIGSLLNSKSEEFWRVVRNSETWHLEEHRETAILLALRLSYHHLPPVYRQCFAYCAVYPKGSIMKKQSLIHEWMANGFIQSNRGMEAEDLGDEIFNGLLQLSFFQDTKHEGDQVVSCKMHDLFHDLVCSITKDECWRIKTSDMEDVLQSARHVSVSCDTGPHHSFNTLKKLSKSQPFFRTLIFPLYRSRSVSQFSGAKWLRVLDLANHWHLRSVPSWIGHLKLLKYLNLHNTGIALLPKFIWGLTNLQVLLLGENKRLTELPSSVGMLKNLRHLDLSRTSIKVLPESICTLTNLQTLDLSFCEKLEKLPRDLKNMKGLRNLIIMCEMNTELLLSGMPVGIGELTRLETLQEFVVSKASEGAAGIQELGRLNKLKGVLIIEKIRHVRDPRDALQANLKNKDKLSGLFLYWGSSSEEEDGGENEEEEKKKKIIQVLEPHPHLQKLKIDGYPGVELPGWVGKLPNLRELGLCDMPNAVHDLQQLSPNLDMLWIVDCPKLRFHQELRFPSSITQLSVGASNDPTLRSVEALPHLSHLYIQGFHEEEYPSLALRNLTRLQQLWMGNCSNVKRLLPQLENLQNTLVELQIVGCHDLDCITEQGWRNLPSLQTLELRGCRGLTSLSDSPSSLGGLKSLTRLRLIKCPKLVWSAVDFQHLVTLKHLHLEDLPHLTSLPDGLQHVTTLRFLYIRECQNLGMLPQWLLQQHLPPSLHYLRIRGCHPELHKRCEVDKGEDWRQWRIQEFSQGGVLFFGKKMKEVNFF